MTRFNIENYDTVESRIAKFHNDYPDGRIITFECTRQDDRAKGIWMVKAEIFLDHGDHHADLPKATGFAFEVEGTAGANVTASLENCETSAIGRALANAGYSGNKRASQTEMKKVMRKEEPIPADFIEKASTAPGMEELTALWNTAVEKGWAEDLQKVFTARKQALGGK